MELYSSFLHSNSFVELAHCHQNIPCGQSNVSERLVYGHILKSIVKELDEKIVNIMII